MKIVIAGASGFVGRELTQALAVAHEVVALSRSAVGNTAAASSPTGRGSATWLAANLFSLLDTERALHGADCGIYLVHSMLPPSRLTQGSFANLDLILADNFARAARLKGLKKIIYLGGLVAAGDLSKHLASRLEVERVLASSGIPVIALRAGLIIGPESSSFRIMERLVKRLPLLICPSWTARRCQPIAVADVVTTFCKVVEDQQLPAGAYDIGGPEVVTYRQMMKQVAAKLNLSRPMVPVPLVSPHLSRLWVSTVTGTPKALVYPLIASLRHHMVATDLGLQKRYGLTSMSFGDALDLALRSRSSVAPARRGLRRHFDESAVTSVQRMRLPAAKELAWVPGEYARWLPHVLRPFVLVTTSADGSLWFAAKLFRRRISMLELTLSHERSSQTRQLYYLTGGVLLRRVSGKGKGRLEFRAVPGGRDLIAAVLDFRPRLPWWLYVLTQAQVHLAVMTLFARHLRRIDERGRA